MVARILPVSHAPNVAFTERHLNKGLLPGGIFGPSPSGRADSARKARNGILGKRPAEAAAMPCGGLRRRHLAGIRPDTAPAAFGEGPGPNPDPLRDRGGLCLPGPARQQARD